MKKHTIQLTAIVVLSSLGFLVSCANQNPTEKTSRLTDSFAQANPSPTYGDPETGTVLGLHSSPGGPRPPDIQSN